MLAYVHSYSKMPSLQRSLLPRPGRWLLDDVDALLEKHANYLDLACSTSRLESLAEVSALESTKWPFMKQSSRHIGTTIGCVVHDMGKEMSCTGSTSLIPTAIS